MNNIPQTFIFKQSYIGYSQPMDALVIRLSHPLEWTTVIAVADEFNYAAEADALRDLVAEDKLGDNSPLFAYFHDFDIYSYVFYDNGSDDDAGELLEVMSALIEDEETNDALSIDSHAYTVSLNVD